MSDLLPLFPLPNVVLFPNVFLPLHIFEPRYREMVADALRGDRLIGMVLLRPGWERDYEGRPPVYPIGCSGVITHVERLATGASTSCCAASNASGSWKRTARERTGVPRSSRSSSDPLAADDRAGREQHARQARDAARGHPRRRAQRRIVRGGAGPAHGGRDVATRTSSTRSPSTSTSSRSKDRRCSSSDSLRTRAESLVELLEMKLLIARTPGLLERRALTHGPWPTASPSPSARRRS